MLSSPRSRSQMLLLGWLCLGVALGVSSIPAQDKPVAPDRQQLPTPSAVPSETEIPAPPAALHGPRVVWIDFESSTLSQDQIKAASQALWARLDATTGLALFPRAATRRWLIAHDLFPFTPYQPPTPPDQILSALRGDYLLTGHLDLVGGVFTLDVRLYDGRVKKDILKNVNLERLSWDALLDSFPLFAGQLYRIIDDAEQGMTTPRAINLPSARTRTRTRITGPNPKMVKKRSQGHIMEAIQAKKIEEIPAPAPAPTPAVAPATTPAPTPPPGRDTGSAPRKPPPKPSPTPDPGAARNGENRSSSRFRERSRARQADLRSGAQERQYAGRPPQ